MNYKLINKITGEETTCSKVVIDGFNYYLSDKQINSSNYKDFNFWVYNPYIKELQINCNPNSCYKVIATNNPSIDLPEVVDNIEELAWDTIKDKSSLKTDYDKIIGFTGFVEGYYQSQESHPYSDEDMIEFAEWNIGYNNWTSQLVEYSGCVYTTKELLQIWKEHKPKTVYYE